MTHGQLTRRITAIVSTLNNLSARLDKLAEDSSTKAPKRAKKAPKAQVAKRAKRSVIGASIVYGGVKGKVVERKGSKFLCEMADGKRKQVSTVYVYRQLAKKANPKPAPQDQPAQAAAPAPQQVTHEQLVAQPQEEQQKAS